MCFRIPESHYTLHYWPGQGHLSLIQRVQIQCCYAESETSKSKDKECHSALDTHLCSLPWIVNSLFAFVADSILNKPVSKPIFMDTFISR